jgi:hypothetical protein
MRAVQAGAESADWTASQDKETIMKDRSALWCAAIAVSVAALAGCGAPGEVPVGNWAGHGTYVDYEGVLAEGQNVAQTRARSRAYETTLKITSTRVFGRDALLLDIHSKRGKLFNVGGDETTLRGVLVELERLDNGSTLYAAFDARAVESPEAAADLPAMTLAQATSVQTPRGLILQLHYNRPGRDDGVFTDTFHFLPGRVIKTGSYATGSGPDDSRKMARVWWVEELRPAP